MIRNLGKVATIIAKAEAREIDMHADVDAWNAPSECHGDVSRHEAARMRTARRHAEATARRPWRTIMRELRARGCSPGGPKWNRLVARLLTHPTLCE